ncbi:MAG TPA: DUF6703 family protein [Actinomycetales bacterium]|nr:DUF6703 family protein [Actinomycetales bacterium]
MPADRDRGQPPADHPLDHQVDRRTRVAQASEPVLQRLTGVRTFLVAAMVGVGVLAALIVDNRWAALGILPALALLGWLSYLAWPALAPSQRVLRVGVLVALLVWAATRLLG